MVSGLIPGLHPNTLIPLLLLISPLFNDMGFAILLISILISANYFEFIKTTYLSTPDSGDVLASPYVQKLLFRGKGSEAVKLLSTGAAGTLLLLSIIAPLLINFIPKINFIVKKYIVIALALLSLHIILKEGTRIGKAAIIFTLAAALGILVLRTELINQPLLPLLAGFYGTSTLIRNIKAQQDIPPQTKCLTDETSVKTKLKGIAKAIVSSSVITFIPAIGPSQASLISNELVKTKNQKEKLITIGGVNTGDVLFSITALFSIHKARSGIIEQISIPLSSINYLILIISALMAGIINYWLVNWLSYRIGERLSKVNYSALSLMLIIFIAAVTLLFCGWEGEVVLLTSTLIGLLGSEYGVNPNHLMAALIVPTIMYYA